MSQAKARIDFAQWLKNEHPGIFKKAVSAAANSTAGLGSLGQAEMGPPSEPKESFWQKFTQTVAGLGTSYLTLKNQRDAMKINLQRAQDGLPPIDMATSAPVIRTQVDMSPELTNRLISTAGEGINKTLLFAGVGIAAAIFMMKKK